MRNSKFAGMLKLVPVLLILIIFCSSCEKDDEVAPDYVGTWASVIAIPTPSGYIGYRDLMIFSENSVINVLQLPGGSETQWIDQMNMKGLIAVSGNMITVTIAEVGISSLDAVTGRATGTIISYKDGSAEFETILSQSDLSKIFKSEYSVSGDKLTLKTDNNDDGDYDDGDEITVYTKQ